MWDIMAFFRGGLNGERAHDDLGKEIAIAGKEWVKQCYRWADLEAYQFRYGLPSPLPPGIPRFQMTATLWRPVPLSLR